MHTHTSGQRLLTELDFARVSRLNRGELPENLMDELKSADLVISKEISADIVTMNSQVEIAFDGPGTRQKFTICYPKDANPGAGRISILSPVGSVLIPIEN